MSNLSKDLILVLALFGDPTLPAGIPNTGGFKQTLREMLVSLAGWTHHIIVVCDTSSYRTERHCHITKNIDLYRVYISPEEHKEQELLRYAQQRILNDIYTILDNRIENVALVHSFYWFSGYLASIIYERNRIPYIHTPVSLSENKISTGSLPNCVFQVESENCFLPHADQILAITEQEKKILIQYYHITASKITVTGRSVDKVFHSPARDYNGIPRNVSAETFISPFLPSDTPWWRFGAFIYLGRMVSIKGIDQIVLAWSNLYKKYADSTPPLWIVGGTPDQIVNLRSRLLQQVNDLPKYEEIGKIIWWGCLDQSSISTLFLKSLALITHSRFEAGGRVILEAMCQGLPVIATPNGFAHDYIKDWFNGFLIKYGDCIGLQRCMEYFIRQPYLSRSMGYAAKETFKELERSWNYVEIHKAIYEHYLNGENLTPFTLHTRPQTLCVCENDSDFIDYYPYIDIKFSEEEWHQELNRQFDAPAEYVHEISFPNSHAYHFSAKISDTKYMIKQFYNRINRSAIWKQCSQKVFGRTEQFQCAESCQHFKGVLTFFASSESGAYYVLPQLHLQSSDFKTICSVLDLFGSNRLSENSKVLRQASSNMPDLHTAIDLLEMFALQMKNSVTKPLIDVIPKVRELEEQTRDDAQIGVNYGKSPTKHIVVRGEESLLLPSASWYWGERGPDYVYAALETNSPIQKLNGQRSNIRQYLWWFVIIWTSILQATLLNKRPSAAEMDSLLKVTAYLNFPTTNIIF